MKTREEFEALVNSIKEKLDETTGALISEELIDVLSSYVGVLDALSERDTEITGLKSDKDELLKVNGKLYQRIGFDKEEEKEEEKEDNIDEIEIEDVIDEKGDMI